MNKLQNMFHSRTLLGLVIGACILLTNNSQLSIASPVVTKTSPKTVEEAIKSVIKNEFPDSKLVDQDRKKWNPLTLDLNDDGKMDEVVWLKDKNDVDQIVVLLKINENSYKSKWAPPMTHELCKISGKKKSEDGISSGLYCIFRGSKGEVTHYKSVPALEIFYKNQSASPCSCATAFTFPDLSTISVKPAGCEEHYDSCQTD